MIITNSLGLPEPLVRAVTPQPRVRQPKRISVTELTLPPQLRGLLLKHEKEIQEDAADRIFALLGTLLHDVLEDHAKGLVDTIAEQKLEIQVNDWTVVGKYDLYRFVLDGEVLTDWKLTSVYSLKDDNKPEWEAQINIYAEILRQYGRLVRKAQIIPIGRDWSKRKAMFDKSYPQTQVIVKPVKLWTSDEVMIYIRERIALHEQAESGNWPECTPQERWARDPVFAIMKHGQKRAVKLCDSYSAAEKLLARNQFIQERPGESIRCEMYCAVSAYCKQYAALKAAQQHEGKEQTNERLPN